MKHTREACGRVLLFVLAPLLARVYGLGFGFSTVSPVGRTLRALRPRIPGFKKHISNRFGGVCSLLASSALQTHLDVVGYYTVTILCSFF